MGFACRGSALLGLSFSGVEIEGGSGTRGSAALRWSTRWPGRATPQSFGYGYQVWLPPGPRRTFALIGTHGQSIIVDPKSKLVMVQTAVRPMPTNDPGGREGRALWAALLEKLGSE